MRTLGLGKTLYNSSACLLRKSAGRPDVELALTERLTRKKASGAWPEAALRALPLEGVARIAENRDISTPRALEDFLETQFPFYEHLSRKSLGSFCTHLNPELKTLTHHRTHALTASFMSPFSKALILVIDGAGTRDVDFPPGDPERCFLPAATAAGFRHEEHSVYLFDEGRLQCVSKGWQHIERSGRHPRQHFSDGIGMFYEKAAEFIFNSGRAAGKVMGLAPLGDAYEIPSRNEYLEYLPWHHSFKGNGNEKWDSSGNFLIYSSTAAIAQQEFERTLQERLIRIREQHPDYENLILTGGCALNCTFNGKLQAQGLFRRIYVPPFPGDEGISLGAAYDAFSGDSRWSPFTHEEQNGYFGPVSSIPTEGAVQNLFDGFEITRPGSITAHAAEILGRGEILAWFQGRSESGPRALGNRSVLARPDRPGLRDELNRRIKFRESFRPYGSSCTHETASEFFEIPKGFDNPYMSFAVRTRPDSRQFLAEVTHVDGTSRMQTVRKTQNPLFHELLEKVGATTGIPCLLNTSLNVMGEPIAETLEDARRFLLQTPVHGLAAGPFYIRKK